MARLFASNNKGKDSDKSSYEDVMAEILRRTTAPDPLPRYNDKLPKLKKRPPVKTVKKINISSPVNHSSESNYQKIVLGVGPKPAAKKPQDVTVNLSFKLKRPTFKNAKKFIGSHKRPFIMASVCALLLVGGITAYKVISNKDKGAVAGVVQIAPKTVFLPKEAPEGFTVGSSKQELENGAILYTVFGPRGEEITINQQASAPDFNQDMLNGGLKFTTPHGTAYVLQDNERITGYLLAEDSWVLLNSTDELDPEDMRILIRSLEPI